MTRAELLQSLFAGAVDLSAEDREQYLESNCPDAAMRAELRELIALDGQERGEWDCSALETVASGARETRDARIGRRLGAYRIEDLIGRGGMGKVYRALRDDQAYRQTVAIKLIRQGLDSEETAARFRFERQILASLDHPNIARLLDGGADEFGLPYLVMEYVEGAAVTEFCSRRALSIRQRLELFQQICRAVEYAHQRMVIHRDLKPGNILVTADGVPKLLDFGIAKLADASDGTPATITGMRLLTPRYASPEQIANETVTTASDVYSLGVVLYEMLTGESPYRSKADTLQGMVRDVCELEPVRPSERMRALRGDLDNIILKALRKDPRRRYVLASQLAEDIGRHLKGRPVEARGDDWFYVVSKFVRRHWIAASVVTAALAGLVVAGFVAVRAQNRAARRFDDVRALAHSMLFEVHDSLGRYPGTLAARQVLVQRAHQYLNALAREEADDELLAELAAAYMRVGSLTNDVAQSIAIHRKGLALSERLHQSDPGNAKYAMLLSESLGWMGNQLRQLGDLAESARIHRRQVEVTAQLVSRDPSAEHREQLAEAYQALASILLRKGEMRNAYEMQTKAVELHRALAGEEPQSAGRKRSLAIAIIQRSVARCDLGDSKQAAADAEEALGMILGDLATDPQNQTPLRDVWYANYMLAAALEKGGYLHEALSALERGYPYLEGLARADAGDVGHQRGLALTLLAKGRVLIALTRWKPAREALDQAVRISRTQLAADANPHEARQDLAQACLRLGAMDAKLGHFEAAESRFAEAFEHYSLLERRDPQNVALLREGAELDAEWAALRAQRKDVAGAAERLQRARALWARVEAAGAMRAMDREKAGAVGRALAPAGF